jgi:hypothetical protein
MHRRRKHDAEWRSRKNEEEEFYQGLRDSRAWTEEEWRKWSQVLLGLQELIRTFPHTEEGEIIADGWREENLAKTMKHLIRIITEPVRRGDPKQALEQLSLDLRLIQERGNCRVWDDFQRKMPDWRKG